MRVLGQDSRLSTVGRPLLSSRGRSRGFILSLLRSARLDSRLVYACATYIYAFSRTFATCAHACACACSKRGETFPHTLALYSYLTFPQLHDYVLHSSPLPSRSSRVFPLRSRSAPVAQSSVHSRSQDEANRPSQTFFSLADARRPNLTKSYVREASAT